jgi:hypothetical protein
MMFSNEELVASNPLYQHLIDNDPDAYYPWTENLEQIAEEEEEIPMPCGYTYALYSMTTTPDQQLIDYKELLATHVTPEFVKVKFFEYECEKNEFRIDER